MGSHLVSIGSAEEQGFTFRYLKEMVGTNGWIGMNNRKQKSLYEWTDGTPIEYDFWNSGQPDDAAEEHCFVMTQSSGRWNNENCMGQNVFVCEKYHVEGI